MSKRTNVRPIGHYSDQMRSLDEHKKKLAERSRIMQLLVMERINGAKNQGHYMHLVWYAQALDGKFPNYKETERFQKSRKVWITQGNVRLEDHRTGAIVAIHRGVDRGTRLALLSKRNKEYLR
jgi:hypothetical protein